MELKKLKRLLLEKAERHESIAEKCRNAAKQLEGPDSSDDEAVDVPAGSTTETEHRGRHRARRGTALERIKECITKNGPMSRAELVEKGFPEGTLAGRLKEKLGFVKNADGRWTVGHGNNGKEG